PSPRCANRTPEPTADGEREPAATDESSLHGATEPRIAAELELLENSFQVCDPATMPVTREKAVASDFAEGSPAQCNMAKGELDEDWGLFEVEGVLDWDIYADLPPLLPSLSELTETAMPKLSPEWVPLPELSPEEAYKLPHSHPLLPPSSLSFGPLNPPRHPVSLAVRLRLRPLAPFLLHGTSLCRLHRGSSSWLWPGSHKSLLPLSPPWTLFFVLLPDVRPFPEPPSKFPSLTSSVVVYGARTRLPGGGRYVRTMDLLCHVLSL
ncbi:hypothetical protein M9458_018457, partial [Cirrhinus mrigala]